MKLFKRSRKLGFAVAAMLVGSLLAAAAAVGVHFGGHTTDASSVQKRMIVQRSSVPAATVSGAFVSLAGTHTPVTVPAGQTDLIVARWAGETQTSGQCAGRIIATSAAGAAEFYPLDPLQLYDTGNDGAETHVIERSRRLSPGNWQVVFQYRVTGGACQVDDWHFAVEVHE